MRFRRIIIHRYIGNRNHIAKGHAKKEYFYYLDYINSTLPRFKLYYEYA